MTELWTLFICWLRLFRSCYVSAVFIFVILNIIGLDNLMLCRKWSFSLHHIIIFIVSLDAFLQVLDVDILPVLVFSFSCRLLVQVVRWMSLVQLIKLYWLFGVWMCQHYFVCNIHFLMLFEVFVWAWIYILMQVIWLFSTKWGNILDFLVVYALD